MQVYVDESGDAGLSGKSGSSSHFVLAAVVFESDEDAVRCRRAIRDPHRALGWSARQEFKFNRTHNDHKERFFGCVRQLPFWYTAVVLNKRRLPPSVVELNESLYQASARLLITHIAPRIVRASVCIDQCGGREFRRQMQLYLRPFVAATAAGSAVHRVRTQKSHACELLQLADMIAGAVARSTQSQREDRSVYRTLVHGREWQVME